MGRLVSDAEIQDSNSDSEIRVNKERGQFGKRQRQNKQLEEAEMRRIKELEQRRIQ